MATPLQALQVSVKDTFFSSEEGKDTVPSTEVKETTMSPTIKLNGVTFVPKRREERSKKTLLHPKGDRGTLNAEQRMKLLENIQAKQQTQFHSITISVNDPEKMTNTYSMATLLAENQRNLAKYDLLDVYNIVFPKENSFVINDPNEGALQTHVTAGVLKFKNKHLFEEYLRLTPEAVADSSKYYSLYTPEDKRYREDLDWSLAYYEKNVESELYSKVYSTMMRYELDSHGGPLFLKLLLDRVTTSGDSTLKSLTRTLKTYSIKKNCKGEDVDKVSGMFMAILENIDALSDGALPTDTVDDLLALFQTTSIPEFNSKFKHLQEELADAEINNEIDPNYRLRVFHTSTLSNDLHSAKYVINYAERTYRRLLKDGTWDNRMQQPPGVSGFIGQAQQPNVFTPSTTGTVPSTGSRPKGTATGTCFNCEQPNCSLGTCPHPRDEERIARNKAKHPVWIRLKQQRHRWRPPEPTENNKRVINGVPHTWNPSIKRGRWVPDATPLAQDQSPSESPSIALTASDITEPTASTSSTAQRRLALHLTIQQAQDELMNL